MRRQTVKRKIAKKNEGRKETVLGVVEGEEGERRRKEEGRDMKCKERGREAQEMMCNQ